MAQAQNPWEVDWSQGGPAATGAPPDLIVGRPDPVADARAQAQLEVERARLQALQIANAKAGQPDQPNIPAGYRFNAQGNLEPIPGGPADPANANRANSGDQRIANLRALERQIADVRAQYEQNFRGGAPNALVGILPNIIRPENGQFDSAAAGMADTGNAAFRIPGSGSMTEGDAARFIAANTPEAGDSDQVIEQKLRNLSTRLEETYRAMGLGPGGVPLGQQQAPQRNDGPAAAAIPTGGPPSGPVDPFGQGGPTVLPTARGAHGDAGPGFRAVGAGTEQTYSLVPELRGLGSAMANAIQSGASVEEVQNMYRRARLQAGATVSPEQLAQISAIVADHARNPRVPVSSAWNGWQNFEVQPDTAPSVIEQGLGYLADNPGGAFAINAANGATAGAVRAAAGDTGRAAMTLSQADHPIASFAGDVAGSTGAMLGGGWALRGLGQGAGMLGRGARALNAFNGVGADAAYGGVRGAMETDGTLTDRLKGAAMGTVVGAAGNVIGQGASNVVGRAVRGVSDPFTQYLAAQGIRLTPGQILGRSQNPLARGFGSFENAMESVPFIGPQIRGMREQSLGDFSTAAVNQALDPIGGNIGRGLNGTAGVDAGNQAVSNAFDNALTPVNLTPDAQFVNSMRQANALGSNARTYGSDFQDILANEIAPIAGSGNAITGRQFQDMSRTLGGYARRYGDMAVGTPTMPPAPAARPVGQAFNQMRDATDSLLQRTNPDAFAQYRNAQQAYRRMGIVRDATDAARNGTGSGQVDIFTPAQLNTAASRNSRVFGGTHGTSNQPFYDLTRAGQAVLPSSLPNSGTADRSMAALFLPAALGGGSYMMGADPTTAATIAAAGLPYTAGGRRMIQAGLIGSARRQRWGQSILDRQGRAGLLGASLLLPAYSSAGQ